MIKAALYARVSSDRQEHEQTIQSQLAELRERAKADGASAALEFIDDGYSRDNLVRPSLDRLRDLIAQSDIGRLYVQVPDRLASGAHLVVLVEEFKQQGVQVIFLKGAVEDTDEGKLLLHMQGAIAEYERAKIAERTRRGKLYWARQGSIVGGHAPYGYRLVKRTDTQRAKLEIEPAEALVVQALFRWMDEEHLSVRAIARRLMERHTPTSRGAAQWQPTVVGRILRNTAYKGQFTYQKTQRVKPEHSLVTDRYRQNRKTASKRRPLEEQITISIPPIISPDGWQRVQEQLTQNSLFSPRNNKRHRYLLRGLIRCLRCGGTYTGAAKGDYRLYRCNRADAAKSATGQRCRPGSFGAESVEQVVWEAVTEALQQPEVLKQEYGRRLEATGQKESFASERKQVAIALKRIQSEEDRLIDAYKAEALELERFKAEMEKLRTRRTQLDQAAKDIDRREQQQVNSRKALQQLETFCCQVTQGLDVMTFEERQQLLRLVVERVTIDQGHVSVETVIPIEGDLRNRHSERSEESVSGSP